MTKWSAFPILILSAWLVSCGHKAAPTPADGQQLRLDCVKMLEQLPKGPVAKDLWPRSVKALKPIRVELMADRITILLQHEDRRFSMGYDVYADPKTTPSTHGVWIQKTPWKGVFIYKTQY